MTDGAEESGIPPEIRLIAGLGNPGREYEGTRHNVGFAVVDRLAAERDAEWKTEKKWKTEIARPGTLILAKPRTYMNLSGEALIKVCSFYKIPPESVLVVFDDVDLPLGRMRFRQSGSAGGHNGVRSLIQHLGTDRFPRLKIGIGRNASPDAGKIVGHVLGKFSVDESGTVEKSLAQAQDAVNYALASGLAAAMNRFNTDPDKAKKSKSKPPKKKSESADTESPSPEMPGNRNEPDDRDESESL